MHTSKNLFRWGVTSLGLFLVIGLLFSAGCNRSGEQTSEWPDKPGPKVLVSFPPLYSFTQSVAGDTINLQSLLTSSGPHGYETTARDGRMVAGADLFFINGLGLDDSIAMKLKKSANPDLELVALAGALEKSELVESEEDHHDHDHDHHHHGEYDPHIWLGIPQAQKMVSMIATKLGQKSPEHKAEYRKNADEYIARLEALHTEGIDKLKDKKERKIITFHESLSYFAKSLELEVAGVIMVTAGVEPSRDRMTKIVDACVKNEVRLIAVEPQYPSNTAASAILEALHARGIEDAAFVEIDPMETAKPEELSATYYEERMRQNIQNLEEKLR